MQYFSTSELRQFMQIAAPKMLVQRLTTLRVAQDSPLSRDNCLTRQVKII